MSRFLFPELKSVSNRICSHNSRVDKKTLLSYGVNFLDKALRGIFPTDLVLLGAVTGSGKTHISMLIAMTNALAGKAVTYIALEESENGLEDRMRYNLAAKKYFDDPNRLRSDRPLNFKDWILGDFDHEIAKYEVLADIELARIENLKTYYKRGKFDADRLKDLVIATSAECDLRILDHIHYMDLDDENENIGIKKVMTTVRDTVKDDKKPMVVISHLRKKSFGDEILPDLGSYHGTSDLSKIATVCITLAPGPIVSPGRYYTYIRILKDRLDGSTKSFIGRVVFNVSLQSYEDAFSLGTLSPDGSEFVELDSISYPFWAKGLKSEPKQLPFRT